MRNDNNRLIIQVKVPNIAGAVRHPARRTAIPLFGWQDRDCDRVFPGAGDLEHEGCR